MSPPLTPSTHPLRGLHGLNIFPPHRLHTPPQRTAWTEYLTPLTPSTHTLRGLHGLNVYPPPSPPPHTPSEDCMSPSTHTLRRRCGLHVHPPSPLHTHTLTLTPLRGPHGLHVPPPHPLHTHPQSTLFTSPLFPDPHLNQVAPMSPRVRTEISGSPEIRLREESPQRCAEGSVRGYFSLEQELVLVTKVARMGIGSRCYK